MITGGSHVTFCPLIRRQAKRGGTNVEKGDRKWVKFNDEL